MVAPVLTGFTDAAPCPRVVVDFPSFVAGTATVTVYRFAGGREHQVRGAVRVGVAGSLSRTDQEAPFNTAVSYRAEQFNAAGLSLGFTETASIVLDVGESWMHNPLDPQGAVRVEFGSGTAPVVQRPTSGRVSFPKGRRVGVVLSEPRGGVRDLAIDVRTVTDADADKVQAMVGDYDTTMTPVVCLRLGGTAQRMRVPQPLFLSALNVVEAGVNHQWVGDGGEISHSWSGDEVDPPIPGLFIPLLRRKDIDAFYSSRGAIDAAHLRRGDIDRRYDLAGYAG